MENALFYNIPEVADRHTCPDHTVDIPDAHVQVEIARSLESLVADFNITLNMTDDASHMDNKYLTLIEVTYDDESDTSEGDLYNTRVLV